MSEQVLSYLTENREQLLKKLNDFLSITSVSTDSVHKKDINEAAGFLETYLKEIGVDQVEQQETAGHPLIYAGYHDIGSVAPTVFFYEHYPVQPFQPIELRDSAPFIPEVRDGRLYARGASDDKGLVFMQLAVFQAFMTTEGKLPIN